MDAPETAVRAALADWAKGAVGAPVPEFAENVSALSLNDKTVYAGFLRCLYDVRGEAVAKKMPYDPNAPLPVADKADPWAASVRLLKQMLDQDETVSAAEPGEPMDCNACAGQGQGSVCEACRGAKTAACAACADRGRKSCASCAGKGVLPCATCRRTGKVLLSLDADGTRREQECPQCMGKKDLPCPDCADAAPPDCAVCGNTRAVKCPACGGLGAGACKQCGGARKVVQGFTRQVSYRVAYHRSLLRDASIPASVFPEDPPTGKLGPTVFEREGSDDAAFADKPPEGPAAEAYARVLAQVPKAGPGPHSRLLLRAVTVEKVPTYEVGYTFEGKAYRAWVCGDRVVPLDDPLPALAGRWARDAEALLAKGDQAAFEATAARIAALSPNSPEIARLRAKAGASQTRPLLALGAKVAGGAAAAVPPAMGFFYRTPNRYAPLAALALAMFAAGLGAVFLLGLWLAKRPLLSASRRGALAAASAAAAAAVPVLIFLLLAPIIRIDTAEFQRRFARYESLALASWTPEDDASLAALDKDFAARGVDTLSARILLQQHADYLAAERARAAAEEEARRAAAAAQAAAAKAKAERAKRLEAQARKEAAAMKAAARKKKAAGGKKKPAKKTR